MAKSSWHQELSRASRRRASTVLKKAPVAELSASCSAWSCRTDAVDSTGQELVVQSAVRADGMDRQALHSVEISPAVRLCTAASEALTCMQRNSCVFSRLSWCWMACTCFSSSSSSDTFHGRRCEHELPAHLCHYAHDPDLLLQGEIGSCLHRTAMRGRCIDSRTRACQCRHIGSCRLHHQQGCAVRSLRTSCCSAACSSSFSVLRRL